MKKLMTMIAAVATAFGLYAAGSYDAGFISGTAFEVNDGGTSFAEEALVAGYWDGATNGFATVQEGSHTFTLEGSRPKQFDLYAPNTKNLAIATTLGNPVFHNVNASGLGEAIGTGLYFDGLVKFTLFDPEDAPTAAGAKIAVYPQLESDDGDAYLTVLAKDNGVTNRYVTATEIAADTWYRLTIKAIADIDGEGQTGFMVFVNGTAVNSDPAIIQSGLLPKYDEWGKAGKIFRSMVGSDATVKAVGFDGKGEVDEIAFTKTAPEFAADPTGVTIGWDTAKVAGISLTEDGDLLPATPNPAFIDMTQITGDKVYYKAVEGYADGYIAVASGDVTTIDDEVTVAVAAVNGKGYADFNDAGEALANANPDATLKLYAAMSGKDVSLSTDNTFTLDLNNQNIGNFETASSAVTIKGPGAVLGALDIVGTLTITDGAEFFNVVPETTDLAINDADDLNKLATVVAAGYATAGKTFKQTANIELTAAFDGIGARTVGGVAMKDLACEATGEGAAVGDYTAKFIPNAFQGTYDGGNHSITGFKIADGDYVGFINSAYQATIKNLKIGIADGGIDGTSLGGTAAVFVGVASQSTMENLTTLRGTVEGTYEFYSGKDAAGIVCYLAGGAVKSCTNNLDISFNNNTDKDRKGGGIVLIADEDKGGEDSFVIEGCVNNGNISTPNNRKAANGIGGILGLTQVDASHTLTIKDCENTGDLSSASGASFGQFIGRNTSGTIVASGNKGKTNRVAYTKNNVDGLNYATVANNVATFVKNAEVVPSENTFKVMVAAAPAITVAVVGNLVIDCEFGTPMVTAAKGFVVSDPTGETAVKTWTARAYVPVTGVTLDITSTNVAPTETFTLIATVAPAGADEAEITWTTSAEGVATVVDGLVTAVAEGEATITATNAASGQFATCKVTVAAASPWPTPDPSKEEGKAVAEAMTQAGFSSAAAAAIGTKAEYTAFQSYCDTQKIIPSETGAAKDNAVLTYALGADACNEEITSEDITIEAYDQAAGKLTVKIEGVTAGETINSAVLAKILTAKGGEEVTALDPDDVAVSGYAPADGEIAVTVAPSESFDNPTAFFYQIELKK